MAHFKSDNEKVDLAFVVDNTASAARGELPPAATRALNEAQGRARERKSAGQVVLIAVNGAGMQPSVVRRVALDPKPGEAESSRNARGAVISCVRQWAREAAPQAKGSDVLAAITFAARQQAEQILVVSDGVANAGELDVNGDALDTDPTALAQALLQDERILAQTIEDSSIVWAGLGDTAKPLAGSVRAALQELWSEILTQAEAKVTFDDQPREAGGSDDNLPPDPVSLVATVSPLPCGSRIIAPGTVLFEPGSDKLRPEVEDLLRPVVEQLRTNPDQHALVTGHTAAYQSQGYRQRLSEDRARAVRAELVRLGAPAERVQAAGYGSRRPLVDEFPGGRHDKIRAAQNRRVEIDVSRKDCAW
ncbi:OmpA family protein [Micromonospora sp. CA-249363]|uniref:OmpA family protein n=1 Tax=Micromonospora sp. CA-249363 TaxID=3239963 RepID=UPI003D9259BE